MVHFDQTCQSKYSQYLKLLLPLKLSSIKTIFTSIRITNCQKPRISTTYSPLLPSPPPSHRPQRSIKRFHPSQDVYADSIRGIHEAFRHATRKLGVFPRGTSRCRIDRSSTAHGTFESRGLPPPPLANPAHNHPAGLLTSRRGRLILSRQRSSNGEHEHWVASTPRLPLASYPVRRPTKWREWRRPWTRALTRITPFLPRSWLD